MADVLTALAALTEDRRKWSRRQGFYSEADWDAIVMRWNKGASCGVLYDALKAAGNMPYKSERSFFRALDNQRSKREFHK